MKAFRATCLLITLSLYGTAAVCEERPQSWLQLEQLNQQSREQLRAIQEDKPEQAPPPSYSLPYQREQLRNTQQRSALQQLQEQQRRQMLIDNQRFRTTPYPPGPTLSPRERLQMMNNQRSQQHMLQRYRLERQLRGFNR